MQIRASSTLSLKTQFHKFFTTVLLSYQYVYTIGWSLVLYVTVILESIMNLIIECDLMTHMI